jgi:hypothetical protein
VTTQSSAHRSELVAVLPQLRQQIVQLLTTLDRASAAAAVGGTDEQAPEAVAVDQALTAARWVLDALDPTITPRERTEKLFEATVRAGYVTHAAHVRLAELQPVDEMAADEHHRRQGAFDLGEPLIEEADLVVCRPADDANHRVAVHVTGTGRLTWTSNTLPLRAPGGHDQLAVTGALTTLAEALHNAAPHPAE